MDSLQVVLSRRWCAGDVEIDLEAQQLLRQGKAIGLRPKAWVLLISLLRKPNALVSARDLMAEVWPNQDVDPKLLVNLASELRRALGSGKILRSVSRRGYVLRAQPLLTDAPGSLTPAVAHADIGTTAPTDWPAPASEGVSFIGREATLARLIALAQAAQDGVPTLADIVGVPGVGKSRLVSEFSSRIAAWPGLMVMRGASADLIGEREPFGPLLQMLQDHLRRASDVDLIADLRRLAPCWLAQIPGLLEPAEIAPLLREVQFSSEGRMRREFTQLVLHWAKQRLVVLVLEDTHWADASTLDWLEHFLHSATSARVLVVATSRPNEHASEQGGRGRVGRSNWMSADRVQRIALEVFDAGETRRFVEQHMPAAYRADGLSKQLFQLTGGLPLLLDLACRDELAVIAPKTLLPGPGVAQQAQHLQERLRRWILYRVECLSQGQILLVQLASCSAISWPLPLLAEVLEMSVPTADEMVDRLVSKGILMSWTGPSPWDGRKVRMVDFSHAMYRETVQQSLSEELSSSLYQQVAAAFLRVAPSNQPRTAPNMALILSRAGLHAEAASALRAHSGYSLERFASREAIRSMTDALAELERTSPTIERFSLQLEIHWTLWPILSLVHGYGTPTMVAAQDQILRIADRVRSPRARFIGRIVQCSATFFQIDGRPDEAAPFSAAVIDDLADVGPVEREQAWFWAGLLSSAQAKIVEAGQHFQACLDVVHPGKGSPPGHYRLLAEAEMVWCAGLMGDFKSFVDRLEALENERRERGSPFVLVLTLFITADALRMLGCWEAALCRYRELLRLSEGLDQTLLREEALACVEGCRPATERNLGLLDRLAKSQNYGRHHATVILIETLLLTGRTEQAATLMDDVALVDVAWHAITRTQMLRFQGDLLESSGGREAAVERWIAALRSDLRHRFLPGALASLRRLRDTEIPPGQLANELAAWGDRIRCSLPSVDKLDAVGLSDLKRVDLRPMLSGFEGATLNDADRMFP